MLVRRFALLFMMIATVSAADEWRVLSGADIEVALEGRKVLYTSGAWQEFKPSGRTLYNAGRDSWGYWNVRDNQYCSQWPPSDLWACYDMEASAAGVRFVGEKGDVTEGSYID